MATYARRRKQMENRGSNYSKWDEEQKEKKAQKTLENWDEEEEKK